MKDLSEDHEEKEEREVEANFWSNIPHSVRNDNLISFGARILYCEISSLTNTKGFCWAANIHFAKIFETSTRTITRWFSELKNSEHIKIQYVERPGRLTERRVFLCLGPRTNTAHTLDTDVVHNNIKNNINNKKTSCPAKDKFTPEDRIVAGEIFEFARSVTPDLKKPNAKVWANEVRLLRTVDNKTHQQIRDRLSWISSDNFWRSNIQSPSGLRRNWDQMSAKANVIKEKTPADLQEEEYQLALKESKERKSNEYVAQR